MLTAGISGDTRAANQAIAWQSPLPSEGIGMKAFYSRRILRVAVCCLALLAATPTIAADAPQKLRVAYAAITAAFSIPWIAKEAGIFQRHGLDV